jgi:oxalate decarboxylase/phosphoglucose isomerase-like protein (cupin superfamily)
VSGLIYYTARRTWATLARNVAHIPKDIIHDALNHSDERMKVTNLYIDKDYSLMDKANKKVLKLFDFSVFQQNL